MSIKYLCCLQSGNNLHNLNLVKAEKYVRTKSPITPIIIYDILKIFKMSLTCLMFFKHRKTNIIDLILFLENVFICIFICNNEDVIKFKIILFIL